MHLILAKIWETYFLSEKLWDFKDCLLNMKVEFFGKHLAQFFNFFVCVQVQIVDHIVPNGYSERRAVCHFCNSESHRFIFVAW